MKETYATLDDYLNDLDAIKDKVAEQTRGMTAQQVKAYFAQATQALEQKTGQAVQVGRAARKRSKPKKRQGKQHTISN